MDWDYFPKAGPLKAYILHQIKPDYNHDYLYRSHKLPSTQRVKNLFKGSNLVEKDKTLQQDEFQNLLKKISKVTHQYQEDRNVQQKSFTTAKQNQQKYQTSLYQTQEKSSLATLEINTPLSFKQIRKEQAYFERLQKKLIRKAKTKRTIKKNLQSDKFTNYFESTNLTEQSFNFQKSSETLKTKIETVFNQQALDKLINFKKNKQNLDINVFLIQEVSNTYQQNDNFLNVSNKIKPICEQKRTINFDLNILQKIPVRQSVHLDVQNLLSFQQRSYFDYQSIDGFKISHFATKQPLKISDFELGKCIGQGKFGQVYRCKHKKSNFICALKKILKSTIQQYNMVEQFIRQLKISYMVNHPNVIKTYGHFDDQFHVFLLMEYAVDGCAIDNLIERKGEQLSSKILFQTLNAIDHLHRLKIVHRDIKPQNIVVFFKDTYKICDFGLSAFVNNQMKHTFCGTPDYVSPQMKDIGEYDFSVDLWSLGVLAYQLILGQAPFKQMMSEWKKSGWKKSNYSNWKITYPDELSQVSIGFMKGLLKQKPSQRFHIISCLKHEFILSHNRNQIECIKLGQIQ